MKIGTKIVGAVLTLTMITSLAACDSLGGISEEKRMQNYIQGMLDTNYLGKYSEDYLKELDMTEEEAAKDYQANLEGEADVFAYVFNIVNFTDELKDDVVALYKKIYAKAKYTVHEGTKSSDTGSYLVEVDIEPIDIINQITDDDVQTAWSKIKDDAGVTDEQIDEMTDEEYAPLDLAYAKLIISMVEAKLPELGYEPQVSVAVRIADDGDFYSLDEKSGTDLDNAIVAYD